MSTKTIVRAEDVHEGDKLTLTFTHHDVEHVITGKVRTVYAGHAVGSWPLQYVLMRGGKIERHTPEWQSARVVEAGGRLFGKGDEGSYDPWVEIRTEKRAVRGGLAWFTDQAVAEAAGDTSPKIIVQR